MTPTQRLIWERKVGMLKRRPARRRQPQLLACFLINNWFEVHAREDADWRGFTNYKPIAKFRPEEVCQFRTFMGREFFGRMP